MRNTRAIGRCTVPCLLTGLALGAAGAGVRAQALDAPAPSTVAHEWTDALLFAIRRDLARPTVHARNLHHVSAAMYDAWAVYDERASFAFLSDEGGPEACRLSTDERARLRVAAGGDVAAARKVAVGHAAWRLLDERFRDSRRGPQLLARFESVATRQGLDRDGIDGADAIDPTSPAAVGARVAGCLIDEGMRDNANERDDYANIDYAPVNPPLDPTMPGNPGIVDPNRWQPLELAIFIDQSGNRTGTPSYLGADWGRLVPFALDEDDRSERPIDGVAVPVWLDPGPPPMLGDDPAANRTYQGGNALVVQWSSMLDPADGVAIDISPGALGNLGPLDGLPADPAAILDIYDAAGGGTGGPDGAFAAAGHALNPSTGEPYAPNIVPRGDYTRVLAEFWADGPDSETPPGHWFGVYNEAVVGHPAHETRLGGEGEPVDALEYDLAAYLALGGAMHDSAIAAWSVKRAYDSVRPVSAIRYMAGLGQSTDMAAPNYSIHGMPLVDGMIETVLPGDPLAGANGENVGKIKGRAWRGPDAVIDPDRDVAGVGWILLENWWPYQRPTFVTPPFAGYVSGHSTFSRAAAEVLTGLTGDAFFPGGLGEFVARQDEFLVFERGPSRDVTLQWATYRDAADQTSLSRIWGGIHPPADDLVGRRMGEIVGREAWARTRALLAGEASGASGDGTDGGTDGGAGDGTGGDGIPVPSGGSSGGGGCSTIGTRTDAGLVWLCALAAMALAARRRGSPTPPEPARRRPGPS